jgi:RNA polymerase sigma-70 factor (ECF subfamily)
MTPEHFNALFRAHISEITRFLARRVPDSKVEDLAADLFEIAWSKRAEIPAGFELPWLYRSARYLIANQRRKDSNRQRILQLISEPQTAPSAESLALADLELAEAWGQLKPVDREVLSLWALDGLGAAELAVALDLKPGTAAVRLSRARAALAEILGIAVTN